MDGGENLPLDSAEEEQRVYQNILRHEREAAEADKQAEAAWQTEKNFWRAQNRSLERHIQSKINRVKGGRAAAEETSTVTQTIAPTLETSTTTVGGESLGLTGAEVISGAQGTAITGAEVAGETFLDAAAESGLVMGGTVGAAGGFEIPVWGWIATGVAAAGGVGYGIYKHYQHKHEADRAAQKQGFKDAAEALDAAKAGFKNSGQLRFVDEAIKKAGMGNDLADYAHKHGHDSLEDFVKTANHGQHISGTDYARSWGYKTPEERAAMPVETAQRRHFDKAQLVEAQHIVEGTATVEEVKDVQRELKAESFDIGKFGEKHDGVDGIAGRFTRKALASALTKP